MGRLKAAAIGMAVTTLAGLVTVASPQAASADDFCQTTRGTDPFYNGPSASQTYDDTFGLSVEVPAGLYDDRFVPQGLAYWNNWNGTEEDVLLISAYDDDDGDKDPDGYSAIFGVVVSGERRGTGLGRMLVAETHAGGLAIANGHVYLSGEGQVRYWTTPTVRRALEGANTYTPVGPKDTRGVLGNGSFLGKEGGTIWTGNFDGESSADPERSMWQYRANDDGTLTYTGVKRPVPGKAQGMTVVGDRFVWGTSEGRDERGNIWVRPTAFAGAITDGSSFCMRAPAMIEGLAYGVSNGNDRVWALYEGGAYTYRDSINPIKRIHSADASTVAGLYGLGD